MASADILYMPALHQGYINYLDKRNGPVGLLDEILVRHTPRLERDIRAIGGYTMQGVLNSLYPRRDIVLLGEEEVEEFVDDMDDIVMPDEDVSHAFADEYLTDTPVIYERTFLRWDRQISLQETIVPPDRVISLDEVHRSIMDSVVSEAQKSPDWWRQVGASIFVSGEEVITTHNHPYPTEHNALEIFGDPRSNFDAGQNIDLQKNIHAEADAIAKAARTGIKLEGAELYVTTFPCPPCARLVAVSGIKKVFYRNGYSLLDAEDVLRSQGIEIILVQD